MKRLDPVRAKNIDPRNSVRLIRSIEIAKALGSVPPLVRSSVFDVLWIGLNPSAKKLQASINKRISARIKQGMLAEAKKLRKSLSKKRLFELGYEFTLLADCLEKKISKQELMTELERWELKYAVRQMRWLKRNEKIVWITSKTEALQRVKTFLR